MDFFEDKLEKINTDRRSITPDPIFTLLKSGIKSYYSTYQVFNKKSSLAYISGDKFHVEIKHEFITRYFNSIICIQLFFEQYIGRILSSIRPLFLYGKLKSEIDLINVLADDLDEIKFNSRKIDYKLQLERLVKLIDNHDKLPEEFKVNDKYHFLKNKIESLRILANQRNNIIHSSEEILPIYFYELLMTSHVLPLIQSVLSIENVKIVRKNYSEINIIEELIKIRLPKEYNAITVQKKTEIFGDTFLSKELTSKIKRSLNQICHLKELGRASYENQLYMHEEKFNQSIENEYNSPKRELSYKHTKYKKSLLNEKEHSEIYNCPCCGTKSLYTFEIWNYTIDNKNYIEKAKCLQCTYAINRDIGEPQEYGLKIGKIFKEI